jgi:hypothetical protein
VTPKLTPIRWIELGLPHPIDPERLIFLQADGPFALRRWYRHPEGEGEYHLDLDCRTEEGGLTGCLHCSHPELYTRKRFPRMLGFSIVAIAAVLVPFTPYYSSLAVAGLLDFVIYRSAPDEVACYVCGSVHRGFRAEPRHPVFDRTIAERLTHGEKAVMGSPMREGGTAGAPDPEH